MPKTQHTDMHVGQCLQSKGHDANTNVNDMTANTDVKQLYVDEALHIRFAVS